MSENAVYSVSRSCGQDLGQSLAHDRRGTRSTRVGGHLLVALAAVVLGVTVAAVLDIVQPEKLLAAWTRGGAAASGPWFTLILLLVAACGFSAWSAWQLRRAREERSRVEKDLEKSRSRLASAERAAGLVPWTLDLRDDILTCTPEFARIFGWDLRPLPPPVRFAAYLDAVHSEDRDRVRQALAATLAERVPYDVEHRILRSDGGQGVVRIDAQVETDGTSAPVRLHGAVRDVTQQRLAEDRMRKLSCAVDQSPAAIVITDVNGIIEYVNRTFCVVTGYDPGDVVGKHSKVLKSGLMPDSTYQELWSTVQDGREWRGELYNRKKNGELFWEFASIAPVKDHQGRITNFLAVKEDLTQRHQYEERLLRQSNYDALTDLPNRNLALDRLASALARARRQNTYVALLFIDLDDFKTVNETLSHGAGDRLLKEVSRRLTMRVRELDTVARLGGDEFAIIATDLASPIDAEIIVQKIQELFGAPFVLDGVEVFATASIGISVFPHDGKDAHALMRNADAALYRSKEHGRNDYQFFTPGVDKDVHERLKVASHLRRALERDEFEVHYQPIFDAGTRELVAAEALLRWHSPELGSVPPDKFVPLAEEIGLIDAIGAAVLREACIRTAAWSRQMPGCPRLAVNVSPRQFRDSKLVETVRQALEESGLPPRQLELEITETLLLNDRPVVLSVLEELVRLGVSLSIDDFGTGYSSLSYLKKFPVSTLKIDRSFISGVTNRTDDAALVTAIIAMAHKLGLRVVAEGVEAAGQLDFLHALGCDFVQGYYLGRPLRQEDFLASATKPTSERTLFPKFTRSLAESRWAEGTQPAPGRERFRLSTG